MNENEYISSGILELYVCGALSHEDSVAVSAELKKHPEIEKEVEEIENALQQLSMATAPYNPTLLLESIKEKLNEKDTKVVSIKKKSNTNKIVMYLGWAASVLLLIGLFSQISQKKNLQKELNSTKIQNSEMEQSISNAEEEATKNKKLLHVYRDRNMVKIPLKGQKVDPNAYAEVHWDKETNKVYLDAKDLPTPPEGKEYQVWSLTLDPLTPTSIGLLSGFSEDENKIFVLDNPNGSQAFGITLEPKGGSKTPTMSQLYTLGTVEES